MTDRPITSKDAFNEARLPKDPPLDKKHNLPDPKPDGVEPNRDEFDRYWQGPTMSADEFKEKRDSPDLTKDFNRSVDP